MSLGPENFTGHEEWAKFPDGRVGAPFENASYAVQRTRDDARRYSREEWILSTRLSLRAIDLMEAQSVIAHILKAIRLEQEYQRGRNPAREQETLEGSSMSQISVKESLRRLFQSRGYQTDDIDFFSETS